MSPLESSYREPRIPLPVGYRRRDTPAATYAQREKLSRERAAARRIDALAVDEAEAIVRRQGS